MRSFIFPIILRIVTEIPNFGSCVQDTETIFHLRVGDSGGYLPSRSEPMMSSDKYQSKVHHQVKTVVLYHKYTMSD